MTRLYLHVGTHKTGTTAIQSFAARHRASLLERGIYYPDYWPFLEKVPKAQHKFAHALAEDPTATLTPDQASILPRHWLAAARHHGADLFVSVEALYRHVLGVGTRLAKRETYLRRVAEALKDFDVVVVLVFRRPDDYLRSLYQEIIMKKPEPLAPFQCFRAKSTQARAPYSANAGLFASIFPEIRCLLYEDLVASREFVATFFQTIGLKVADLEDVGMVRKSLSVPETRMKNFANGFLADRRQGGRFLEWMRTPEIRGLIDEAFGREKYDLWESHAAREAFLEDRADDLEGVRARFFPKRNTLFQPLRAGETPPCAPEVPAELRQRVLKHLEKAKA